MHIAYSRGEFLNMSEEYLSKEEIRKWRSSVEKITLEDYAKRLGKKIQEEKKTNDLADMLYTHFNPHQSMDNYDTVTKLEKIDLTPKTHSTKSKHSLKDEFDDFDNDNFNMDDDVDFKEKLQLEQLNADKPAKKKESVKKETVKEKADKTKEEPETKTDAKTKKDNKTVKEAKDVKAKAVKVKDEKVKPPETKEKPAKPDKKTDKAKKAPKETTVDFSSLNITFVKPLTDREEKVLAYFVEKRGEIVYAKDLADLLELKRDYIYKYIKNLRGKMSTDIIANADNGGFKLE